MSLIIKNATTIVDTGRTSNVTLYYTNWGCFPELKTFTSMAPHLHYPSLLRRHVKRQALLLTMELQSQIQKIFHFHSISFPYLRPYTLKKLKLKCNCENPIQFLCLRLLKYGHFHFPIFICSFQFFLKP